MARTIQSPGVEINEVDLSSRTVFPVGTNVHIQGFSANGPTDETLSVSTFAEFELIYGAPTNAAERYFYHTVKSAFNSPANIMVSRLPYGNDKGEGFTDELYSALVFPVSGDDYLADPLSGGFLDGKKIVAAAADADGYGISGTATQKGTATPYDAGKTVQQNGYTDIADAIASSALVLLDDHKLSSVSDSTHLQFGSPIRIDLLPKEYQALKNGEIEFIDNCIVPLDSSGGIDESAAIMANGSPDGPTGTVNYKDEVLKFPDVYNSAGTPRSLADFKKAIKYAGMILVNKAQTMINTYFEGYYIAFGDNAQFAIADGTAGNDQFNAINGVKTFGGTGNYFDVPEARLNFSTTAHTVTGAQGSMSEVFENIPSFDIATDENKDTVGIGVFKLRKSIYATDTTMLDFTLDEAHVGSLDAYRQIANINGGKPKSFYLETLETASTLLSVYVNKQISEKTGTFLTDTTNPNVPNTKVSFHPYAQKYAWGIGTYQEETPGSSKKSIGSIVQKIERNFEKLQNLDEFDIDVTLDAGLSTINTYVQYKQEELKNTAVADGGVAPGTADKDIAVSFDDELVVDISGIEGNTIGDSSGDAKDWTLSDGSTPAWGGSEVITSWKAVANSFIIFAQSRRKDHMTIIDPLRYIFVQGKNGITMKDSAKNFSQHVFYPLKHLLGEVNTNYAAMYGNWAKQYDALTDKNFWAPNSGLIGAAFARNDQQYQPWFAPAGFTRGLITNALDMAIRPNQKQRDQFYKISLNPIAFFPGDGFVIFGQKTMQSKPSAFDRINVRRMFLYCEKAVRRTVKYLVFEPNDFTTRTTVLSLLNPIFQRVKSTRGLFDYLIVCDERNNPPSVIDNNELVVDIYIKPTRAAEFILVNFFATRTDQNFSELIG